MTDTLAEAASTDAQWHRLSARMLLIHPVIELGRALPALLGLVVAGSTNGDGGTWGLAGAGLVMFLSLSRWFTTRLRITDDQIQLRHGLLRRRTTAAPVERVRTVDVTSHLLHRVLGLARVSIGTGTSDRRGRGRLVVDGLTAETAERLRTDLLHHTHLRTEAKPQDIPIPAGEYEIARLDPAWIRYAPFTLSGALTGLIVFGFAVRLDREAHVNVLRSGPFRIITDAFAKTPLGVQVGAVLLAVAVFVTIASTAGYVLAFWGFRLTRHTGGTVHVTRGLITSRATSIERRRLVGAELAEPLLLRWVGGARCIAIATGLRAGRGAERGGEVLLPPAPRAAAAGVAAAVLGDGAPFHVPLIRHPRAALRRRLVRALVGAGATVGIVEVLHLAGGHGGYLVAIAACLIPLSVPLAIDRYRSLGHAIVDGYVVMRFGSFDRRHSTVHGSGIIGWNLKSTFFQRRLGLTTLTATTAAGKQRYRVYDMDRQDAIAFAEAAVPGLLEQFRAAAR